MATPDLKIPATINPDNHGARVTIAGGVMLAAMVLMIVVCFFNRYNAGTIHHPDSVLIILGAALDVACFSVYAAAVNQGFGRHTSELQNAALRNIEELFLISLLLFFLSHGVIKISYNVLARKTSRSDRLKRVIDGFTGLIAVWTISNIIVVAISLAQTSSPARSFFWTSGIVSVLIVLGQLGIFLWIIWKTKANLKTKIQWSMSMGAFVPLCLAAIILRLAYTPYNYFGGDWTFDDVFQAMLFLIELNLVTITVLAPNLPVFFKKTSTGGVYFLPGEAVGGSRSDTRPGTDKGSRNHYALSNATWSNGKSKTGVFTSNGHESLTSAHRSEGNIAKKASFDSDRILIRTSIDIEHSSERNDSRSQHSGEV